MAPRFVKGAVSPYEGRTFIIVNPAAGQENPARQRRRIGGAFASRGATFDMETTQSVGHARTLAREAAEYGYRAVCVVGGDGTIAEAASGLAGSDTPLAIIPAGTGNQVALNLGLPRQLELAVDVAVYGRAQPIDLGRIGDRSFALVAGAGYDAAVMAAATRELKARLGFGAYVYAALREALTAAPRRFRIVADGKELELEAVTVMIGNVAQLFARWIPMRISLGPAPAEAWNDGLFDVLVLTTRRFPEFAEAVWRATSGNFAVNKRLLHLQAREITVEADPPIAVQIDGDPAGMTPMTAHVMRGALSVLVPM